MYFKHHIVSAALVALFTISTAALAGQAPSVAPDRLEAQRQQAIDLATAPVHSAADLNNYMTTMPANRSPLDALSPAARQRFIASLKFNQDGLTSYNYQDLEAELTTKQAYAILSLFGAQHSSSLIKTATPTAEDRLIATPPQPNEDYRDFSCLQHATCVRSPGDICIGSNC